MNQLVVRINNQILNKLYLINLLVNEEQCLRDIEFDEKFGALRDDHHPASREAKKKK